MKSFPSFELLDTSSIDHSLNSLASIGCPSDDVTSLGMAIHAVACPLPDYVIAVTIGSWKKTHKPKIQVTSHYFRQSFDEFDTRKHTDTTIKLSHEGEHCTVIAIEPRGSS